MPRPIGGVQLERPVDLVLAEAREAHRHAQQHVERAGRHGDRQRAGRAQVAGALEAVAEVLHASERRGRDAVREGAEADEQEERERGDREVAHGEERAVAGAIEQRRLRPCGDGEAGQDQRLLVVEPLQERRQRRETQHEDRRAERRAVALGEPARQHQQQQAGQRRGDVAHLDDRQRHDLLDRHEPRVQRGRRRAEQDEHAAGGHEAGHHTPRQLDPARRAPRRPRQQHERRRGPRHDVVHEPVRDERRRRDAALERQVRDPERVAAAEAARHEARQADRLAEEERPDRIDHRHDDAGRAEAGGEREAREQPVEPPDDRRADRRARAGIEVVEPLDPHRDQAPGEHRGVDDAERGGGHHGRMERRGVPRHGEARQGPAGEPRRERDRDRQHARLEIGAVLDGGPVEPEPDRRPGERAEREEVAPREGDRAVAPPLDRARARMAERDDVVEPHDADVHQRDRGRGGEPPRLHRAQRRQHAARMDLPQRLPRQRDDDADDDDGEEARRVADEPHDPRLEPRRDVARALRAIRHGRFSIVARRNWRTVSATAV